MHESVFYVPIVFALPYDPLPSVFSHLTRNPSVDYTCMSIVIPAFGLYIREKKVKATKGRNTTRTGLWLSDV